MHFPRSLCSGSPGESLPGPGSTTFYCPAVAGQSMVPRFNIPSRQASFGAPRQEGPSVPSRGLNISPPNRTVETMVLASEGALLIDSGLSTEVVETILHSRAPSTRKLYALKWKVFTSWCSDHQLDPVNCPVGTVLGFLQEGFTAGLALSTLKVYVAAISAYHIPLGGMALGKTPWYLVIDVMAPDHDMCHDHVSWPQTMTLPSPCLIVGKTHLSLYFPNTTFGYDAEHVHSTSLVDHGEACS